MSGLAELVAHVFPEHRQRPRLHAVADADADE